MTHGFMKRDIVAFIINLFIIAAELSVIIIKLPRSGPSAFRYYTLLSNLMGMAAGIVFMLSFFSGFKRLVPAKTILRFYATCMLAFTFIIVTAVLTPMAMSVNMDPSFLYLGHDAFLQHLAHPVLSFVSFVFLEDNRTLKKKQPSIMLLLTLCYAVVLILLNAVRIVDGPYPFLQIYNNPVWVTILWITGLSGFNYLMNFLIYKAGTRHLRHKQT